MKPDKPEKSSLKKTVKAASKSIRQKGAAIVARLKSSPKSIPAEDITKTSSAKAKRKAAAKSTAAKMPSVPPILLEDDKPAPTPASGPGQRYALGPVPAHHADTTGELPEAYGTKKLLLAARDPHWLYARWDLTRDQQRKYNVMAVDKHLVLRIFLNEAKGSPATEVHVHPESTHWFVHVPRAGAKYVAELGYYRSPGKWVEISKSGATLTPPDSMSDDANAEFATIPMDLSFAELMEFAYSVVKQNIPLVEVLQQLRASGFKIPASETRTTTPVEKWTPERQRALSQIITMDSVRRVWMGSLEITELIKRKLEEGISSMAAAQFGQASSPMGALTSLSSAFGGEKTGRQKGFWFNVNAELIIYGATEPDATVMIGGKKVKLRPDGSFSYRFALPDGEYELPAVAVSADQSDARAAELKFTRGTEYHGDVGRHPQDPALKPPLLENVA